MHVLSLLQNKFGLVFFRLFDGALETSNFRFEEARSASTLLRCFLHENTECGKIARVQFGEELGTISKNRLRWITLVRGPIWGIHSLTLMISWFTPIFRPHKSAFLRVTKNRYRSTLTTRKYPSCGPSVTCSSQNWVNDNEIFNSLLYYYMKEMFDFI